MTPRTDRLRIVRRVVLSVAGVLAVVVTALICLLVAALVALETSTGYSAPTTPVEWTSTIAAATRALSWGITISAIGLIIGATVSAILARTRHRTALGVAAFCSALFGATLLFSAIGGSAQVQDLTVRAVEATAEDAPIPVPWPALTIEPVAYSDALSGVRTMLEVSLSAAVDPVTTADGSLVDAGLIIPETTSCGETRTRLSLTLNVRTDNNALSIERILAAWTAEGYESDRAMQTDIRYSDSLPVESLSIRDTSTIDGLIDIQISSRCVTTGDS